jgi:hypothetical protein
VGYPPAPARSPVTRSRTPTASSARHARVAQ